MSPYLAEAVGTMILILLGDGVVANVVLNRSKAQNSGWIVISAGWAVAVTMAVYAVGRISGAHLNPAVTLGMAAIGAFKWSLVPGYILAQITGAFLGGLLVWLTFLAHWPETESKDAKLSIFCTVPAIRKSLPNFITEFIATALLLFGILAIAANAQKMATPGEINLALVFSHGLQPALVGLLVWGLGLSLGGPTGYAINPARDLGPRIAHALLPISGKGSSDWGYSWIPIVAPLVGGIAGAKLFSFAGF
jgi:glycerol uptake facilitator protein